MPPLSRLGNPFSFSCGGAGFVVGGVSEPSASARVRAHAVRKELDALAPTVRLIGFAREDSPGSREQLGAMARLWEEGADAVVWGHHVSDAVKVVDGHRVVGSLDRSTLVSVSLPVLLERRFLARLLSPGNGAGELDLPGAVLKHGLRILACTNTRQM